MGSVDESILSRLDRLEDALMAEIRRTSDDLSDRVNQHEQRLDKYEKMLYGIVACIIGLAGMSEQSTKLLTALVGIG
jgi:hypothetical protein